MGLTVSRLEDIKNKLHEGYGDDPTLYLCDKLIDYIAHLPNQETGQLTAKALARGTRHAFDGELLRAITILVSSPEAVLDSKLLFIDDDGTFEDIAKERYEQAVSEGSIVHPVSGVLLEEYDKYVFPYFVPTEEFRKAIRDE